MIEKQEQMVDPRRKDGQGLDFWAAALLREGLIDQDEFDSFVSKNNSKEEIMEQGGFPQLKHYGFFNSIHEIRERLTPLNINNERFIIRCSSKENKNIKRLIDAGLDDACAFAEKLPGGFEKWNVEMKEFVDTKASGTIIVEPTGRTSIETWAGPHYEGITNIPKYTALFDPEQSDMHFTWSSPEPEFQEYAMKALRYMFPHLKPKPDEPIYVEYGVKPSGEIYFIEANDSPLLTGKYKDIS